MLQLYWPLAKVATEENLPALQALIYEMQADRDDSEQESTEGLLGQALWRLVKAPGDTPISYDAIAKVASFGRETVTHQKVGFFLRGIGLRGKRKGHRGPRLLTCPREEILSALRAAGFCPEAQDDAA